LTAYGISAGEAFDRSGKNKGHLTEEQLTRGVWPGSGTPDLGLPSQLTLVPNYYCQTPPHPITIVQWRS